LNSTSSPLLTDLYQLTMVQAYLDHGMDDPAVYEFFVRKLPESRNFLVCAGLESVLDFLETASFSPEDVAWLESTKRFSRRFLDYLSSFHFNGEVHAMPEGTIFFADEPILRVTAPIPMAQMVETRIINLVHFQTLVASKAARIVLCAPDKLLVEFGLRRAHGAEAGMLAARASYISGFQGTSDVLADRRYGIPTYGTMAHSFVQAHGSEETAFLNFAHAFPDDTVLLIDTYDTETAAGKVVRLAQRLKKEEGIRVKAVRIDSGDLGAHAFRVRSILDQGGCGDIGIFASGNLDEYIIRDLSRQGAPIGGYGVGTRMVTSADAPYLDCAYKLQEYAGKPRRKRSEGKATWPGRKQVYRTYGPDGRMEHDVITVEEDRQDGEPLIAPVMKEGRRLQASPPLSAVRDFALSELARLPMSLRGLEPAPAFVVHVSGALRRLARQVDESMP
jgi:nicotinate phosphoribosyltransferase